MIHFAQKGNQITQEFRYKQRVDDFTVIQSVCLKFRLFSREARAIAERCQGLRIMAGSIQRKFTQVYSAQSFVNCSADFSVAACYLSDGLHKTIIFTCAPNETTKVLCLGTWLIEARVCRRSLQTTCWFKVEQTPYFKMNFSAKAGDCTGTCLGGVFCRDCVDILRSFASHTSTPDEEAKASSLSQHTQAVQDHYHITSVCYHCVK